MDRTKVQDKIVMTDVQSRDFDGQLDGLSNQLSDALSREEYLISVNKRRFQENQDLLDAATHWACKRHQHRFMLSRSFVIWSHLAETALFQDT
eukprot:763147-Hanusia_phi.AAC.2